MSCTCRKGDTSPSRAKWRKRNAKECGGEGGKPGPCPEHLADDGAEHGVGGETSSKVKKGREKLNTGAAGVKAGKITDYQHQVITDVKHLAGAADDPGMQVTTPRFANKPRHGEHGSAEVNLAIKDPGKIKAVAAYAQKHGLEVTISGQRGDGRRTVSVHAPKKEHGDAEKQTMRLYNAAAGGDKGALSALADKLQEDGNELGEKMATVLNSGRPDAEDAALHLAVGHKVLSGSLFSKKGTAVATEGVVLVKRGGHWCRRQRWAVCEQCEACPTTRVDRKAGIIRDVLVLGRKARNGRRYTDEAMEAALEQGLYDGLQVYVGPHKRRKDSKRSPNDHAGELRGLYKARDGIRAREFHVNRASRGGRIALEIADRFPRSFGLSHHADVAGYETEDGEKIVTRILEVAVADIVKDAATTDGVFEEVDMSKAQEQDVVVEVEEAREEGELDTELGAGDADAGAAVDTPTSWAKAIKDLIAAIHDDDDVDDDVKMKATKKAMEVKKLLGGDDDEEEEEEEEEDDAEFPRGEEEVDVRKIVRTEVRRAVAESARRSKPRRRPTSAARSTVVEDATPAKRPAKQTFPKKPEDIVNAYADDED